MLKTKRNALYVTFEMSSTNGEGLWKVKCLRDGYQRYTFYYPTLATALAFAENEATLLNASIFVDTTDNTRQQALI